jgi:sortase A
MYQLTTSGKSLADIQTAWHNYYIGLPDDEKHAVWREFYAAHGQAAQYQSAETSGPVVSNFEQPAEHITQEPVRPPKHRKARTVADLKQQISHRVSSRGRLKAKHHLQSLLFGLASGALVVLILLFGLFNERFIAPLITPSRNVNATPIITDPSSTAATTGSEIIIPKINVEIPVVYDEPSIDEAAVETALERGVVHYATTPNPGELGNAVIFGHSSNNILNKGKYKFAFVLLSRMESGDLFYLDKGGKRYVYQVFAKKIVDPSDVSVLDKTSQPATATLITCDPPGTSLHRLIVIGKQISPDPLHNKVSHVAAQSAKPAILPSNSPSLWSRITSWFH